jgi:hypothetical protein
MYFPYVLLKVQQKFIYEKGSVDNGSLKNYKKILKIEKKFIDTFFYF